MTNPLTAPECDLRDFAFMPLDVRRLLTSETWIEAADDPKLGHALVSLWCESWQQVPAGSLPNNERVLARFAMCDAQEWERIRERALEGWQLCSDGRLYHPVVAEKARDSWQRKLAQRERTRKATEERERRRHDGQRDETRDVQTCAQRNVHQGTGTGTGTGIGNINRQSGASAPSSLPLPEDRFWSRLDDLGAKGIGRFRCTQLLKLTENDFVEANRILDGAEGAKKPGNYLGGVIRRLEMAGKAAAPGANANVPAWVNERRLGGVVVDSAGPNRWRCLGETLNDAGEVVGF